MQWKFAMTSGRIGAVVVVVAVLFVLASAAFRDPVRAAAFVGVLLLAVGGALALARLVG